MKKLFLVIFLTFFCVIGYTLEIISYGVDGSSSNKNVVIKNRKPIVFFEYKKEYVISNFEIKLSTYETGLQNGATLWYILKTTDSFNTINNIVRVEVEKTLYENTTYYILFNIYANDGSSLTVKDIFYTIPSAVDLKGEVALEVDYNNPFCPKNGEITKIRYSVKNVDLRVKVFISSISGRFVKMLVDDVALKDMVYSIDWDGKDNNGDILPQGIYLVTILTDDNQSVNRLVAIIDKRR